MKKFFSILVSVLIVLGLASCSMKEENKVVGTWNVASATGTINEETRDITYLEAGTTFLFNSDGTMVVTPSEAWQKEGFKVLNGNWSINNDETVFVMTGSVTGNEEFASVVLGSYQVSTLSAGTMILRRNIADMGDITITLKK